MDRKRFWKIIAATRGHTDASHEQQIKALRRELAVLEPNDIIEFQRHFDDCHDLAYRWDLWGAAYIIGGGCGDDSFMDFRSWLISRGQEVFELALQNVETLVDVPSETDLQEDCCFEEFAYVPAKVYEERIGHELPRQASNAPLEPAGERWEEEGDDLAERFPKLWAKFGPER